MKVYVVGGFLGAGKTTAIRAAAGRLAARGERVAVITNDQGTELVDSTMAENTRGVDAVHEVGGGCFCCRYESLDEALEQARAGGATAVLAEAVGSCTDIVATVLSPLAGLAADRVKLAPFAVFVDPFRAREVMEGQWSDDISWLFGKQIEEADVIVLSRSDLAPPDVRDYLRERNAHAPIVSISSLAPETLEPWLDTVPLRLARALTIDYDRYAKAEAELGWLNAQVRVHQATGLPPAESWVRSFLEAFDGQPIAHLKLALRHRETESIGVAQWVASTRPPQLDTEALPPATQLDVRINARIATDPDELRENVVQSLAEALPNAHLDWRSMEAFRPGRPVPTHRFDERFDPDATGACCAAFYQSPTIQYLLGDSWHPGGPALTLSLGRSMALNPGDRVLDVACGSGRSLRELSAAYGIAATGVDLAPPSNTEAGIDWHRGDAHALPFADDTFDALLCECAVSTFADPDRALAEFARVLEPGGRLGISDMVLEGDLPPEWPDWLAAGACLSGARPLGGYESLLRQAGFTVEASESSAEGLVDLLRQVKRRVLTAAVAKASGTLPPGVDIDVARARDILRQADEALAAGIIRYGWIVARLPEKP